ncbi:hypothetical protein FRC04_011035 [Tulasnella sp. 424]|nr:hypothetical protein FRC04_011035 [Tulasnella sp. 424]
MQTDQAATRLAQGEIGLDDFTIHRADSTHDDINTTVAGLRKFLAQEFETSPRTFRRTPASANTPNKATAEPATPRKLPNAGTQNLSESAATSSIRARSSRRTSPPELEEASIGIYSRSVETGTSARFPEVDSGADAEDAPYSPTPSSSSESDVFYSARSSFVDDSATEPAEIPPRECLPQTPYITTALSAASPAVVDKNIFKLTTSTATPGLDLPTSLQQESTSAPQNPLPRPSGDVDTTSPTSTGNFPPAKRAKLDIPKEKSTSSPASSILPGSDFISRCLSSLVNLKDGPSRRVRPPKSFNDLPPEAQKNIMQLVLPIIPCTHEIEPGYTPRPIKSYYKQIYALTKVCKRWKRTIEELPKLWAHVANVIPLNVVDTYLARSKNEGVEIVLFASTAGLEPTDGELRGFSKFINRVERNRQRWCSLVVMDFPAGKGNHIVRALFDVPARPAPGLKEVYVGTRNNMPLSTWKPLDFKSAAPNLRVLCVHGVTPDLGDYTFARQLERLHIVNPSWVNTLHLIGVLAINHTIRHLKLVNIKFAIGEERLKQDIEVFNLPRLESFSFSTLDTSAEFGQLFTRLNAPNCTEYDIAFDLDQLRGSKIKSSGAGMAKLEWNLLGFSWQHFLNTLRKRIATNFVYPEEERQWFDWQDIPSATPIFEWRSGSFADGVAGKGPSFRIRIRTKDRGGVYEWVDLVQKQADELRMGRRLEGPLRVSKENGRTAGDSAS